MALSLFEIRRMMHPDKPNQVTDDFRIIDSYTEYDEESSDNPAKKKLKYLCYELEMMDPQTGERKHVFKAIKFARVIRVPEGAKQSTSLMDMQEKVLSSVYEGGYNLITVIANIIKPRPIGVLYLYGTQGVALTIAEAKNIADQSFIGFIHSMQGKFRTVEMRHIYAEEAEWLREKMYHMDYLTVIRGIPWAEKAGEDAGNKGMGGSNVNPDSQGTLEDLITGMVHYEYILEILATPVQLHTLKGWQMQTQRSMTEWYSKLQGTESISMNVSLPVMYMSNVGTSNGWSKGYSDAHTTSYSRGTNFSTSQGQSVGQSLSQSFGRTIGNTAGTSFSTSYSRGLSHTRGVSFGETFGETQGVSRNISYGQSHGVSENISESISRGTSQNVSFGQSAGTSVNIGHNEGTSQNLGLSASQSQNIGNSLSQGINSSQSHSVSNGTSFGVSQGQSTGLSHSLGQGYNVGFSQNQSVSQGRSASYGQSVNQGISQSLSDSYGVSQSRGWSSGQSANASHSITATNSGSWNHGSSESAGGSEGFTSSQSGGISIAPEGVGGTYTTSGSDNHGSNWSSGYSDSYGGSTSSGESLSQSYGASFGENGSTGFSHTQGASVGATSSFGQSVSNGASLSASSGYGLSQGASTNESYSTNVGKSLTNSFGASASVSDSTSLGRSLTYGQSISNGISNGVSQGVGASQGNSISVGQTFSNSVSQGYGISETVGRSHGYGVSDSVSLSQGYGESYSASHSKNIGQSESVGTSETLGQSVGRTESQSASQSASYGYGQNIGRTEGVSNGQSTGVSRGESTSISNATNGATSIGTSSSMGIGPSIGYNRSNQWLNQGVKDLIELLEYSNNRIKKGLRGNGAFYTYVYIGCHTQDALSAAQAIAKSTWQNEYAMIQPVQVLNLSETEQKHLLYRFSAFSADISREVVAGAEQYRFCTVLLPEEMVAYTHLPRVSEGGILSIVQDIPKFSAPSAMDGEIYIGTILNPERYDFDRGYKTYSDYRIDESMLMHGFFTGASRSGKTVAAMRFIAELSKVRRKKTGKRLRIVVMDPKQDWRALARFVEPERFNFYSMGNPDFQAVKINVWKIPHGVRPQIWIDGIIDIYCRAYGFLERGKQMIAAVVYDLYDKAGVMAVKTDEPGWQDKVHELSANVCFNDVYKHFKEDKEKLVGTGQKAGNATIEGYDRILERLSCFARDYSIESKLYGTKDGMCIDELIGKDDVTVLESKGLENTFKNFIFGAITSGFYKYAFSHDGGFLAPDQYETVLVIEEANEILTGNDSAGGGNKDMTLTGQSEFEQILDQSAGYGLFVFAITQKIADMPSSIIANSGIVFAGRIKRVDDINVIVRTIGREERIDDRPTAKLFPRSPTGWFVCQTSRAFDFKDAEPILVAVSQLNVNRPDDTELEEILLHKRISQYLEVEPRATA